MAIHSKTRLSSFTAVISLFALLLIAPLSAANSDAISEMAGIVSKINHFPSDEQKNTLSKISGNENYSNATQVIAQAIHDIEHQPTDEHRAALEEITKDSSASDAEKTLAKILMDFNHTVGSEAEASLKNLMDN